MNLRRRKAAALLATAGMLDGLRLFSGLQPTQDENDGGDGARPRPRT